MRMQAGLQLPIATPRLRLREMTPLDANDVHHFVCDPRVTRFLLHTLRDNDEAAAYLRRVIRLQREKPRGNWELAAEEAASGNLIGACNLTLTEAHEADLGYMLRRSAWGRGYATEIARALLTAGFKDLRLERVISTVDVRNAASIHVLEKTGFRWEATYRKLKRARGRWRDCHLYVLPRAVWEMEMGSNA
jgi:ribosomal-protein-alanine N-acetyltransferase